MSELRPGIGQNQPARVNPISQQGTAASSHPHPSASHTGHPPHPHAPAHPSPAPQRITPAAPARPIGAPPPAGLRPAQTITPAAPAAPKPVVTMDEPIELVDDELEAESNAPATGSSKIHGITGAGGSFQRTEAWKRVPFLNKTGAIRVKTFHGRLSEQGMEYLDNAINDWLDKNHEIEIKQITSNVGLFDGKIKEPALIINVWY